MTEAGALPVEGADDLAARAAEDFLARVEAVEPQVRAFRSIDPDRLRAEAAVLDALPPADRGPLHGLTVAVKEVFDVAGYVCGWGTPIHDGRRPDRDAWAVAALRRAGALIAGITVSTEYAMATPGPTTNPFDPTRTPGASSQGSAAAVGGGMVSAALGSQTIGSIIRPAAYCGCIGVKPTFDAIDAAGCMPLSGALDHVGFMAGRPDTVAALLDVLMPGDGAPENLAGQGVLLNPWYPEPTAPWITAAVETAARTLGDLGTAFGEADLPSWIAKEEADVMDVLLSHDMALHHGGDCDSHGEVMSERVRGYIDRGRKVTAAQYDAALARQKEMADAMDDFVGDGVLLMPATTDIAPLLTEGTGPREPQRLWTLVGLPAMTVPVERIDGLPVGVQVIARRGADRRVLAAVRALFDAA